MFATYAPLPVQAVDRAAVATLGAIPSPTLSLADQRSANHAWVPRPTTISQKRAPDVEVIYTVRNDTSVAIYLIPEGHTITPLPAYKVPAHSVVAYAFSALLRGVSLVTASGTANVAVNIATRLVNPRN